MGILKDAYNLAKEKGDLKHAAQLAVGTFIVVGVGSGLLLNYIEG